MRQARSLSEINVSESSFYARKQAYKTLKMEMGKNEFTLNQ